MRQTKYMGWEESEGPESAWSVLADSADEAACLWARDYNRECRWVERDAQELIVFIREVGSRLVERYTVTAWTEPTFTAEPDGTEDATDDEDEDPDEDDEEEES